MNTSIWTPLIGALMCLHCIVAVSTASDVPRIVIDPQYGGKDRGPISREGKIGKDIALSIATRLSQKINKQRNYHVLLTRNSDVFVPLERRLLTANKDQIDILISIGVNGSKDINADGLETVVADVVTTDSSFRSTDSKHSSDFATIIKDLSSTEKSEKSKQLGNLIHSALVTKTNLKNRGIKFRPLYILLSSPAPSVMVYPGFLTNPKDAKLLGESSFQDSVAQALLDGVTRYFERPNSDQK